MSTPSRAQVASEVSTSFDFAAIPAIPSFNTLLAEEFSRIMCLHRAQFGSESINELEEYGGVQREMDEDGDG